MQSGKKGVTGRQINQGIKVANPATSGNYDKYGACIEYNMQSSTARKRLEGIGAPKSVKRKRDLSTDSRADTSRSHLMMKFIDEEKSSRRSTSIRSRRAHNLLQTPDSYESSKYGGSQLRFLNSKRVRDIIQQESTSKDLHSHLLQVSKQSICKNQAARSINQCPIKKKKNKLKKVISMVDTTAPQVKSSHQRAMNHSEETSGITSKTSNSTFFKPDIKKIRPPELQATREYDIHTPKLFSKIMSRQMKSTNRAGNQSSSVSSNSRCPSTTRRLASDEEKSEDNKIRVTPMHAISNQAGTVNLKDIFEKTRKAVEQVNKLKKFNDKPENNPLEKPKKTLLMKNRKKSDVPSQIVPLKHKIVEKPEKYGKLIKQTANPQIKKKKKPSKDTLKRNSSKERSLSKSKSKQKERNTKTSECRGSTKKSKERTCKKQVSDSHFYPSLKKQTHKASQELQQDPSIQTRASGASTDVNPTFRKILTTKMNQITSKNILYHESASKIQHHWRNYKSRIITGDNHLIHDHISTSQVDDDIEHEPVCMKTASLASDQIVRDAVASRDVIEMKFKRFTEENERKFKSFLKSIDKMKPDMNDNSSFIDKVNEYKYKAEMCLKMLKSDSEIVDKAITTASNEYKIVEINESPDNNVISVMAKVPFVKYLDTSDQNKSSDSELRASNYISEITRKYDNTKTLTGTNFHMTSMLKKQYYEESTPEPIRIEDHNIINSQPSFKNPQFTVSPSVAKQTSKPIKLPTGPVSNMVAAIPQYKGAKPMSPPESVVMGSPNKLSSLTRIYNEPFPQASPSKPIPAKPLPALLSSESLHQSIEKTRRHMDTYPKDQIDSLGKLSVRKDTTSEKLIQSTNEQVIHAGEDLDIFRRCVVGSPHSGVKISYDKNSSMLESELKATPNRNEASESKRTEKKATREFLDKIPIDMSNMDDSRMTPSVCLSSLAQSPRENYNMPTKRVWTRDVACKDRSMNNSMDKESSRCEMSVPMPPTASDRSNGTEEKTTKFNIHSNTSKSINIKDLGSSMKSDMRDEIVLYSPEDKSTNKKEIIRQDKSSTKKVHSADHKDTSPEINLNFQNEDSTPPALLKTSVMPFNGIYDDPQEEIGIIDEQLRQEQLGGHVEPSSRRETTTDRPEDIVFASQSDKAEIITSFILENLIIESLSEDFCLPKFIQILGPHLRGIETSSIASYIDHLFRELKTTDPIFQITTNKLNMPIGHNDLQRLLLASPLLTDTDHDDVGLFDYEPVMDIKLYICLEEMFRDSDYKTRQLDGFEMEREHIIHKMIFDSMNECLDYRRKGGISGVGMKFSKKYRPEVDFDHAMTQNTLQAAKQDILRWNNMKCGTVMEKEPIFSYNNDSDGLEVLREKLMGGLLKEYVN